MYDLGRAPGMATGAHLFSGGNMERLEWIKDEEVVFCPSSALDRLTRFRGASGMICGRQVGKSWGKKKAKSVLVRWKMHRKGVSCFRIRGQKRAKSDWTTSFFKESKNNVRHHIPEVPRFEEEAKHLHPLSYCSDCPLRLKRLVCPCEMPKIIAVRTNGQGMSGWRGIQFEEDQRIQQMLKRIV